MSTTTRCCVLMLWAISLSGCESCHERTYRFPLSSAQVDRVTEGTGSPTTNGCNAVCHEQELQRDGGTLPDGGLPMSDFGVVRCSLEGQQLTCDFGQVCLV